MQGAGSVVRAGRWLIGGVLLGTFLLCAVPTLAGAHPVLQRSDPANNAVLHTAPEGVRLWFSAVLDPAFSTAVVENTASASVNERDAQLVAGNARELEIPLAPHLAPGTYAVIWRVVSDADGYILSGSSLFAIARADGSVPGQAMQSNVPLAQRSSAQITPLTLFVGILTALAALALVGWMGLFLWLPPRPPARQNIDGAGYRPLPRLRRVLGWGALVGMVVVLGVALGQRVASSTAITSGASHPAFHLHWPGKRLLSAFHATLLTTDQQDQLVLDVSSDPAGRSMVTVTVADVTTGEPVSDVGVSLRITMLDMPMGDTLLPMRAAGRGRFSASLDLSMGGLWQLAIQLSTTDHRLHEATVKLLTAY